ncbi:hypothetical protein ANRL4_00219 [Anaerolineae bacterium]|nr:hypothetical protein ANRL4_00219 [Anaerolineae bacterium]
MLDRLIDTLSNLNALSPTHTEDFEKTLSDIASQNDPDCIGKLVKFFRDDAKYDELMFSIIHTIEVFEDVTYTREIQKSLPTLWAQSPKWAMILHVRILNSPSTLDAYITQVSETSVVERHAIYKTLQAVESKWPEFSGRCKLIIDRLAIL